MAFDQTLSTLNNEIIKEMKLDLYNLIRRYCNKYKITDFKYELFLHDSTKIEYMQSNIIEIERFSSIVNNYWSLFPHLMSNLSFDEEKKSIEFHDRIQGTINFEKTIRARANQQISSVVICNNNSKNMFTPENILLASTILGINILANKFLKAGLQNQIEEFKPKHELSLQKIIDYTQFLLMDRFLKKLVDYYLLNYNGIEKLLLEVNQKINQGKLPFRYFDLIRFMRYWKKFNQILNENTQFLKDALIPILDDIKDDKLYEMWIFYKIISVFEPVYQKKNNKNIFESRGTKFSIEYQREKTLGWHLQKKGGYSYEVKRFPDIVIRKNGVEISIIDAKCMRYSDIDDGKQEPGPNRNIVNQMILYLDYDNKCDLGLVLFADNKIRDDIIITQENRKIIFLNCYPYHESAFLTFEKLKEYLKMS